jgi:hypothetical protein
MNQGMMTMMTLALKNNKYLLSRVQGTPLKSPLFEAQGVQKIFIN